MKRVEKIEGEERKGERRGKTEYQRRKIIEAKNKNKAIKENQITCDSA